MSTLGDPLQTPQPTPSSRDSSAPLLEERAEPVPVDDAGQDADTAAKKRRLLGFGKKKVDEKAAKGSGVPAAPATGANVAAATAMKPPTFQSSSAERRHAPGSPQPAPHPHGTETSPTRRLRSSSPRLHSPASSQIFERDVQESTLPSELSPAIPSHVQIDDHIPPVLEASSLAITDDHLNPDDVEIVMHAAHEPAAVNVVGGSAHESGILPPLEEAGSHHDVDDTASHYGAIDTADPRRLSFISFADVVHAEHAESSRDSVHLMSLSSTTNRSPSPVRSPASSHGYMPSPPTSGAPSMKGVDITPKAARIPPASPISTYSPSTSGELTIETMRQALRSPASGDLSGTRSQPLSAVGSDEAHAEHSFR